MIFTVFSNTEDKIPKQKTKSWNDLAKQLTTHRIAKHSKESGKIPLLSLVSYKENTTRKAENIEKINAAVLDLDYITEEFWNEIRSELKQSNVSSFWYTTYSHRQADRKDNFKLRLIIELSRPVVPSEWKKIFPNFVHLFNIDTSCSDPNRMFFGPFIQQGSEPLHFSGIQEGNPLDVELLLENTTQVEYVEDLPPPASVIITKKMLTMLSSKLLRRSDAYSQIAGQMIKNIRDGEAFTEEGYRDEAIFRYVISSLVREWPGLNSEKMTELATNSLELSGGVTPDQFLYKLNREKDNRQQYLEKLAYEKKELQEKSTEKANLNRQLVGLESYYLDEALGTIDAKAMFSGKLIDIPIKQAKVVQHHSDYYFWCNGTYTGPIQKTAFRSAAVKYLSPFQELEKEFFDSSGHLLEFDIDDFVNRHGTFVQEIILALGSDETSLSNDTLVLPYYPPLPVKAEYSWRVDLWIRFLFGGTADPVGEDLKRVEWAKRWLYHYQNHELLLPALLFVGVTGAGKGLFCEFLSQAYNSQGRVVPLELLYSTGNENEIYPVMVADEEFPNVKSSEIRNTITKKTHEQKKKYQNIKKVRGYIRHIFILNDADHIKTFDVGVEAQKATAERFMYVNVTQACREYFEMLCENNEKLQPGELQAHIAWMHEQELYGEIDKGRFVVSVPEDNQAYYETFYRHKGRFDVLNVLCDWVCKESYPTGFLDRYGQWPIEVIEEGIVIIRTAAFCEYVEGKIEERSKSAIGRILKSIAQPTRKSFERYWILDKVHLFKWAAIAMEYSDETIEENLNKTTESKVDSVGLGEKVEDFMN